MRAYTQRAEQTNALERRLTSMLDTQFTELHERISIVDRDVSSTVCHARGGARRGRDTALIHSQYEACASAAQRATQTELLGEHVATMNARVSQDFSQLSERLTVVDTNVRQRVSRTHAAVMALSSRWHGQQNIHFK